MLDAFGQAISCLYAAGTGMASVMGGYYPTGNINLGPPMLATSPATMQRALRNIKMEPIPTTSGAGSVWVPPRERRIQILLA